MFKVYKISYIRGKPSITFFNRETRQVVIFDQETKIFITAYKLAERHVNNYLTTGRIGKLNLKIK